LASLWVGVNVFFVLSGFLITGILLDTKHEPHYFKFFYMRRVLRIFPLYYGTLIAIFFVLPALKMAPFISASQQFWYWTYLGNWGKGRNLNVGSLGYFWSLGVEEQFYLVWPLVIYVLPRRSVSAWCCAAIAASFSYRSALFFLHHPVREAYFGTPARVED